VITATKRAKARTEIWTFQLRWSLEWDSQGRALGEPIVARASRSRDGRHRKQYGAAGKERAIIDSHSTLNSVPANKPDCILFLSFRDCFETLFQI